jgi:hypothetical protein
MLKEKNASLYVLLKPSIGHSVQVYITEEFSTGKPLYQNNFNYIMILYVETSMRSQRRWAIKRLMFKLYRVSQKKVTL